MDWGARPRRGPAPLLPAAGVAELPVEAGPARRRPSLPAPTPLACSALEAGWVRVGATLALLFGAYYLGAALDDAEGRKPLRMYQATVLGRLLLAAVFSALVAAGQCGHGLLALAAVNLAGAARMHAALRSDGVGWGLGPA